MKVSPGKTQFNLNRFIFLDGVVHAVASLFVEKLLVVEGQDKAPTVFLVHLFPKVTSSVRRLTWSP